MGLVFEYMNKESGFGSDIDSDAEYDSSSSSSDSGFESDSDDYEYRINIYDRNVFTYTSVAVIMLASTILACIIKTY